VAHKIGQKQVDKSHAGAKKQQNEHVLMCMTVVTKGSGDYIR